MAVSDMKMPDSDRHFQQDNGTNATQKQKPQTIKSKLVVWDFCFCRDLFFVVCLTYGWRRSWKRMRFIWCATRKSGKC